MIEKKNRELSDDKARRRQLDEQYNGSKNSAIEKASKSSLIGFSIICFVLIATLIFYAIIQYSLFNMIVKYIVLGIIGVTALIFLFIEINDYKAKNRKLANSHSNTIVGYKNQLDSTNNILIDCVNLLSKMDKKSEISKLESEIDDLEYEIGELEIESETKSDMAEKTYQTLLDRYSQDLHTSDWINLDRLIYYITTNRADSIKEALNALDVKINNEILVSEIRANADHIAAEINRSNSIMFQTITKCAEELNSSIRSMGNRISKSINENNKRLESRLDAVASASLGAQAQMINASNRLISSQELTNSLLKNSDKTSSQLLNEVMLMHRGYGI